MQVKTILHRIARLKRSCIRHPGACIFLAIYGLVATIFLIVIFFCDCANHFLGIDLLHNLKKWQMILMLVALATALPQHLYDNVNACLGRVKLLIRSMVMLLTRRHRY